MSDEHSRIEAITARLAEKAPTIEVGIGDDAAVLAPSPLSQVLSVDVQVEGVHFRRDWASLAEIGRRAFIAAMSDLAAMGAEPRAALLSLVLPNGLVDTELLELVDGVAEGAAECSAPVVGGNLAAGQELSITTTVIGAVGASRLTRRGASPGDGVYVVGNVGSAALGLELLRARRVDGPAESFVHEWRRPVARLTVGQRLIDLATAAIDVSDGLLQDLGHLCHASNVGADVDATLLPTADSFEEIAAELSIDATQLAISGGEDYGLLFSAPLGQSVAQLGTRIGHIREPDAGIRVLGATGQPIDVDRGGYQHFR